MLRIACIVCDRPLKHISIKNGNGIASCGSHEYPIINNVLYAKQDNLSEKAIRYIKRGKIQRARLVLLNLRLRLGIPTIILLKIHLPFNYFIKLLKFFGYDSGWSNYLLKRTKDNSYKISLSTTKFLKYSDKVLDFGCGVGQILPKISTRIGAKNLFALDSSFLNLLIARKYFANNKTVLICGDGEQRLPFRDSFLNCIIATDSFHYIDNKSNFIKESSRVLDSRGLLFIIQTINASGPIFEKIKAIKPKKLYSMISKNKFDKINILTDKKIVRTKPIGF